MKLRAFVAGREVAVDAPARTLGDALRALASAHPHVIGRVVEADDCSLADPYIVLCNGLRVPPDADWELRDGDDVTLLAALGGGQGSDPIASRELATTSAVDRRWINAADAPGPREHLPAQGPGRRSTRARSRARPSRRGSTHRRT